ncbi:SpdA protein [Kitasatospora sp. NPDC088160]|uniref:SpdA protein n=1 Tax=Kitasatospora sp. NPDC088160 TaxID=3364072 RepID=UPI0038089049
MVDLSVLGLLVALHHLSAIGTDSSQLRSATRLMHLCGVLTLALNTAEPILAGHYERATLDAVAPLLLLGWGVVGPALLRQLHTPSAPTTRVEEAGLAQPEPGYPSAGNESDTEPDQVQAPGSAEEAEEAQLASTSRASSASQEPAASRKRTGRKPAASMDELLEVVRPAVAERGATHAVIKEAVRGAGLSISNDRVGKLLELVKSDQTNQPEAVPAHAVVA